MAAHEQVKAFLASFLTEAKLPAEIAACPQLARFSNKKVEEARAELEAEGTIREEGGRYITNAKRPARSPHQSPPTPKLDPAVTDAEHFDAADFDVVSEDDFVTEESTEDDFDNVDSDDFTTEDDASEGDFG